MTKASAFKKAVAHEKSADRLPDDNQEDVYALFVRTMGEDTVRHAQKMVEKSILYTTDRKAYFTENAIVKGALNIAQREVSKETLERKEFNELVRWCVAQKKESIFYALGTTGSFTTIDMWNMENRILELAGEEDPKYVQSRDVVEDAISRKKGISQEQTDAVYAACLSPKRVTVIEGTAGAGKSFTMEAVKETYMDAGYEVMGTALGWAAAKVLGESTKLEDENCKAIEGLTRSWLAARANGADPFQGPTLLIVDEAGMVGTEHMALILEETRRSRHPVKVVLTGDTKQVVPVKAGNALELITEFHGTTTIKTIRRQHQASHRRAVMRLSEMDSGKAMHTFMHQECLHWCKDKDMMLNMVVRNYLSYRLHYPDKKALVLTLNNKDVLELNFRIRAAFKKLGLIGKDDVRLRATNGIESFECEFSVGDEVLLRANDKNALVYEVDTTKSPLKEKTWKPIRLGVFNRNYGRIVAIRRSEKPVGSYDFVVDLGGDKPGRTIVNSENFRNQDEKIPGMCMVHNYAGTIYGSQGQTVPKVFLIDSPNMSFRLSYVGMSRHKESVEVFLDETELHLRMDKSMGKRQSLNSRLQLERQGKLLDDAVVHLGRYTRSAMLQSVALTWGKHSTNLTAVMYERIHRIGEKQMRKNAEKAAEVKAVAGEEIVDFIAEYNEAYPMVDVAKILDLPDPIEESELVRPSDVEENIKNYGNMDMPVDADATPLPMPVKTAATVRAHPALLPTEPQEDTFFGKAFGWMLSEKKKEKEKEKEKTKAPPPVIRQKNAQSAFDDVEGVIEEKEEPISSVILEKLNAWLDPKPKVKIPYEMNNKLCGKVVYPPSDPEAEKDFKSKEIADPRPHHIDFTNVPQVANVEGGPNNDWIASQRNQMWAIGKYGEPRILAKDPRGVVLSRYRLNGECVVGEGFPPICVNAKGTATSPVYIVAGAKEWLWLRQTLEEKFVDEPHKVPHMIWGAKDVDWKFIAPSLKSSERVVIVRSKADDRQIPWALSMQKLLKKRFNVDCVISPAIPEAQMNLPLEIPDPVQVIDEEPAQQEIVETASPSRYKP